MNFLKPDICAPGSTMTVVCHSAVLQLEFIRICYRTSLFLFSADVADLLCGRVIVIVIESQRLFWTVQQGPNTLPSALSVAALPSYFQVCQVQSSANTDYFYKFIIGVAVASSEAGTRLLLRPATTISYSVTHLLAHSSLDTSIAWLSLMFLFSSLFLLSFFFSFFFFIHFLSFTFFVSFLVFSSSVFFFLFSSFHSLPVVSPFFILSFFSCFPFFSTFFLFPFFTFFPFCSFFFFFLFFFFSLFFLFLLFLFFSSFSSFFLLLLFLSHVSSFSSIFLSFSPFYLFCMLCMFFVSVSSLLFFSFFSFLLSLSSSPSSFFFSLSPSLGLLAPVYARD